MPPLSGLGDVGNAVVGSSHCSVSIRVAAHPTIDDTDYLLYSDICHSSQ